MATNQGFKSLVPGPNLDAKFLYHWLKSKTDYLQSLGNGATFKELSKSVTAKIEIPLPSLGEQRRIAAILDRADALRVKRRQVLVHLDALTQSIFHDMFGAANDPAVTLADAIKWSSGRFLPAKAQRDGPFPVFGGNGVNGYHDEYMYEDRRLVIGRVGAYCGAVHVTPPKAWVTDNALVATVKIDGLSLDYLLPALSLTNLRQFAGVSGQPSISAGRISHVRIPLPARHRQAKFASRTEKQAAVRATVLRAQAADEVLFVSLESRAFRGEL
jgi:type I restriction enzyme S subunit